MEIKVGNVLRLKKPHPCGGYHWEVLRVGADFRLKCTTCHRVVMLPRAEAERRTKEILSAQEDSSK
jgi:hypothetical protein